MINILPLVPHLRFSRIYRKQEEMENWEELLATTWKPYILSTQWAFWET